MIELSRVRKLIMFKHLIPSVLCSTALLGTVLTGAVDAQNAACGSSTNVFGGPSQCVGTSQNNALSCNAIPANPSHRMSLSSAMAVEISATANGGSGQPSLMIVGPDGCFYAIATRSGGMAKIPGLWSSGEHAIYVGDVNGAASAYTLSITQD
jgi:hypothetical protein